MAVIGIDSHKDVLAGCLVDTAGQAVEHRSIANTADGHAELVAWVHGAEVRRVGIEGAGNYGRPAATQLLGAGVAVVEVPPQMTAAARRGRRTRTKTRRQLAVELLADLGHLDRALASLETRTTEAVAESHTSLTELFASARSEPPRSSATSATSPASTAKTSSRPTPEPHRSKPPPATSFGIASPEPATDN